MRRHCEAANSLGAHRSETDELDLERDAATMDVDAERNSMLGGGFDPEAAEEFELKGDALNDGFSDCASSAGSRFSMTSRASPSPRASLRGQVLTSTASLSRRRGRSDATCTKQPTSRQRESSVGSASPADSQVSSQSLTSPTRSSRSASTSAPSVDPRGDQELLQLMDVGDPLKLTCLDLSAASKKTKKSLKSLQSLADFVNLSELNVANNAIASLDGIEVFTELVMLNISRNHIKRIDPSLFALVNLQSLDLCGNFISHIPRGIAALDVLEELNLSGNNLSALKEIDVLGKLVNLHTCNLAANPFCKLPTYKDYAVSKLLSLERLDDAAITDHVRDKSRRRFSDEMFSKDKCLRDAGAAYASEQSKLREMQLALEAENVKLKDELQLKSKLLQNKSRAWSNATEQLLQLQHDLAMMNLDRRHSSAVTADANNADTPDGDDDGDSISNQPEFGSTSDDHSEERIYTAKGPQTSRPYSSPVRQNIRAPAVSEHEGDDDRQRIRGTSPVRDMHLSERSRICDGPSYTSTSVDSACSPIHPLHRVDMNSQNFVANNSDNLPPQSPPKFGQQLEDVGFQQLGMLSPHDYATRLHRDIFPDHVSDGDDGCDDFGGRHPLLRFPTFEDDSGCPAYDDPGHLVSTKYSRDHPQAPITSPETKLRRRSIAAEAPSPLQLPRSHRIWERQRAQLVQETSRASPRKSPKRSQVLGLVDKDNLVRQIQALQSCKQSFVGEIAKEEQLLHELKRESSNCANQIERLDGDLQVLVGTTSRGGRAGSTSQQREEETIRAKLEMLRNKLHHAEDKEDQIEATIVRMTKRVLEEDIQHAKDYGRSFVPPQAAPGPFDKEIFALTHNLQLVIVEKEEIHSEMSRLMNQLRRAPTDGTAIQQTTGLSSEALLLIDQHEQLQLVSAENQSIFIEKQRKIDEFKRKLRDVHDRIKIKEDLLASLVGELKDVESELVYINELTPQTPGVHRRSLSLDSMPSSISDVPESVAAPSCVVSPRTSARANEFNKSVNPRNPSSTPKKNTRQGVPTNANAHESISTMVEAAAADVNSHFEQKFKELFSPEVLEAIKQGIYDKLSAQLQGSSASSHATAYDNQLDLHSAIAAALDVHMKKAIESFDKQRDNNGQTDAVVPPSSPKKQNARGSSTMPQLTHQQGFVESANDREIERECWDEVDDFMPVPEATYAANYRFVKEKASGAVPPPGTDKCSRGASAQRVQKACERLEQAELECKIDTFSGIECDVSGKKRSDLKVMIMGARDLPTSHLRTKNLDPYVVLEIVYPQHVRPQAKTTTLRLSSSMLSQGRHAFIDEPPQLPSQSFRSRTVKKTVYPVWDEAFEFAPVHSLKGYLHVRILNDRKLSREQLVGEVKIPLRMLVDQKKVIESFLVRTSASGPDCSPVRRHSATHKGTNSSGSGTIRIQLQLSFSRIEKYKRAVDDLVGKYVGEYNQLPPFIERIDEYEARLAAPTVESHQEDDHAEVEGVRKNGDAKSLPSYETWKAQQRKSEMSDDDIQENDSSTFDVSKPSRSNSEAAVVSVQHHNLSSARSASLWSTPSAGRLVDDSRRSDSNATTFVGGPRASASKEDAFRTGTAVRSTRPSSHNGKNVNTNVSAKAAMAQLRNMVNANKSTPATTTLPQGGASFTILNNSTGNSRRRSMTTTIPMSTSGRSPNCFDDYSPYHPDFQLLDPLGIETMNSTGGNIGSHHASYGKPRSTSFTGGLSSRGSGGSRRTDLRIFKSPGFSRREPSGGFPERFIGLDTQTSERIKRIFGRIDSQA